MFDTAMLVDMAFQNGGKAIDRLQEQSNFATILQDLNKITRGIWTSLPGLGSVNISPAIIIAVLQLSRSDLVCSLLPIVLRILSGVSVALRSVLGGKWTDAEAALFQAVGVRTKDATATTTLRTRFFLETCGPSTHASSQKSASKSLLAFFTPLEWAKMATSSIFQPKCAAANNIRH
jgi:hypothetical protein